MPRQNEYKRFQKINVNLLSLTALHYYFGSFLSLLLNFNWWVFPQLVFQSSILVRVKGLSFYVSSFLDIWTLKEVIIDKQYEAVLALKKGLTVIDIGAATGEWAVYAAQSASQVIAFECDNERIALLNKNIKLNHTKNITVKPVAATSLKQALKETAVCDFLKIDCEGCEYEILNKAPAEELARVRYIALEAHLFDSQMKEKYRQLIHKLKKNHFKVWVIPNPVHDYICFVYAENRNLRQPLVIT